MAASALEVMNAMASQLAGQLTVVDGLEVVGGIRVSAPTPPMIDIFPPDDEPFYTDSGFGSADYDFVFIVRARVTTADQQAGQEFLLSLMDPNAPQSVIRGLEYDVTLGGKSQTLEVDAPSNYGLYADAAHQQGLLGCTWRSVVTV